MRMRGILFLLAAIAVGQFVVAQEAMGNVRLGVGPLPPPVVVAGVAPVYPPLARTAAVQGTVVLDVSISKDGEVVDVQLISGPAMLAPAAIDAVRHWKYKPYLVNGVAFDLITEVSVKFRLK